jgi:hypothetical protein
MDVLVAASAIVQHGVRETGDLLLESLDLGAEAYRYSISRLLLSHRLFHVQQRKNLLIIYLPQIGLQQKTLDGFNSRKG